MSAGVRAIRFEPIARVHITSVVAVTYLGLCALVWQYGVRLDDPYALVDLFSLSHEANLPTWFASGQLLACAAAVGFVASATTRQGGRYVAHWWFLAAAFVYISLDEAVQIHEVMNHWFDTGGVLYFGWVIPAGIIVALFVASYVGFLNHLPSSTRNQFLLAGAVFVGGALGIELGLGLWAEQQGDENVIYGAIDWIEESMELCGIALMLRAVIAYAGRQLGLQIRAIRGTETIDADRVAVDSDRDDTSQRRSGTTWIAAWALGAIAVGVLVATGQSTRYVYEDAKGHRVERTSDLGEDLREELKGGQRFVFARTYRAFDRSPAVRLLVMFALGAVLVVGSTFHAAGVGLAHRRSAASDTGSTSD